ncbi:MAG: hypothetical protein EP314_06450 [Bacteroidetes bacterium]|nr:MAG: hypothetical protein EP314_06450 [Bacteroidota bacterium]
MKEFLSSWLPYVAIVCVYLTGANLDVMEVDAAQYASISLEMFKSGEFLEVYDRNEDYLDKPPLLFWLSAISFWVFGVGNWQYKLPSILFSLLGIFSTYKLGGRLYSQQVGRYASWIHGSSLAMMMINNDIKTDTILVASIVFSIWMLVSFLETEEWKFLFGASVGMAAAMLTKGPIGLMMPALAIGAHVVFKRQWRHLFKWHWMLLILLVGTMLVPMCLGLYTQHGSEGIRFYFWTQSFGRITGESHWQNDTTPLYFTHVFLWSFLPWTFLAIAAIAKELTLLPRKMTEQKGELFLIGGICLVWIGLSLSRFKLPHYIFVVYPLIAILTAKHLQNISSSIRWSRAQLILSILCLMVLIVLLPYCFPDGGWWVSLLLVVILVIAILAFLKTDSIQRITLPSFMISIGIGLGLNLHFYPQLLRFQANAQLGKWVKTNLESDQNFVGFATGGRALDFYAGGIVPWMEDVSSTISVIAPGTIIYADTDRFEELTRNGRPPLRTMEFEDFQVQRLNAEFLNPRTREKALRKKYLLFY